MYLTERSQFNRVQPPQRRTWRRWALFLVVVAVIFGGLRLMNGHALAADTFIKAGQIGLCLDVLHDDNSDDARLQTWHCNNSAAQNWQVKGHTISHGQGCLAVQNDSQRVGAIVTTAHCGDAPGQVWLRDQTGFENPNSGLCLSSLTPKPAAAIVLAACDNFSQSTTHWTPIGSAPTFGSQADCTSGSRGQRLACEAEKQWSIWQTGQPDHLALLSRYTADTPQEEWCADFISYVYKAAGYPFAAGETAGWDENNANNIQNMGFTQHDPSDYTPQAGDVAYFNYEGGHVEMVVSGGKHPTFVYGNSGTRDLTTGNGQMAANTITHDKDFGQLVYYLSPN